MTVIEQGPVCHLCHRGLACSGPDRDECLENPKVNVGSGQMLKREMINFDCQAHVRGTLATDMIGQIKDIDSIFPADFAAEILCAHVIEHFYMSDAIAVLGRFRRILRPGGKLVIEAPCLKGSYWYHVAQENGGFKALSETLYGNDTHRIKWGEHWCHKSGWTGDLMADELRGLGMNVVHVGIGLTHGMGRRDFRVEAIK
jgi:hypothetical protein